MDIRHGIRSYQMFWSVTIFFPFEMSKGRVLRRPSPPADDEGHLLFVHCSLIYEQCTVGNVSWQRFSTVHCSSIHEHLHICICNFSLQKVNISRAMHSTLSPLVSGSRKTNGGQNASRDATALRQLNTFLSEKAFDLGAQPAIVIYCRSPGGNLQTLISFHWSLDLHRSTGRPLIGRIRYYYMCLQLKMHKITYWLQLVFSDEQAELYTRGSHKRII